MGSRHEQRYITHMPPDIAMGPFARLAASASLPPLPSTLPSARRHLSPPTVSQVQCKINESIHRRVNDFCSDHLKKDQEKEKSATAQHSSFRRIWQPTPPPRCTSGIGGSPKAPSLPSILLHITGQYASKPCRVLMGVCRIYMSVRFEMHCLLVTMFQI